jgi:hypothetical protein
VAKRCSGYDLMKISPSLHHTYRNSLGSVDNLLDKKGLKLLEENMENLERIKKERMEIKEETAAVGGPLKHIDLLKREMEHSGLNEAAKLKYITEIKENEIESERTWEDILSMVKEMKGEDITELKKTLEMNINQIIESKKSPMEHEMMHQVASIFGGGRKRTKTVRHAVFKEYKIIAEMESLCKGLIWKLISGLLYISNKDLKSIKNLCKICSMALPQVNKNRSGKAFLLNLVRLIVNDAKLTDPIDSDSEIWNDLKNGLTENIIEGEDYESSDDDSAFDEDIGEGSIGYKPSISYVN